MPNTTQQDSLARIEDQNFARQNYSKSSLDTTTCLIPGGKYVLTGPNGFRILQPQEGPSNQIVGDIGSFVTLRLLGCHASLVLLIVRLCSLQSH